MSDEEREYLADRLSDARVSIAAHERGKVAFPTGEIALLHTIRNICEIALREPPGANQSPRK